MSAVLVLADTHLGSGRRSTLVDILGDRLELADCIIHAGDIVSLDVLESLARFAPVTAVQGNNDVDLELPSTAIVEIDGHRIAVVHDSGAAAGRSTRLAAMFPDADGLRCQLDHL